MYIIKAYVGTEEYTIYNPHKEELTVGNPYYEIGDNVNGQAEFTIYPSHPFYDKVNKLTTDIVFYKDGEERFAGRVLYDDEDFSGAKKVFVEGELAYFCDSIQRPKVYHDATVWDYVNDLVKNHNEQVEERKRFVLKKVSVTDPNDSLYRYSNWEDTRTILKEKLTDRLGGHLVIEKINGTRYLSYLSDEDYYKQSSQVVRFGKNLIDYSRREDASEVGTCLIPLGARLEESSIEGLEERLTIKESELGTDYICDQNAIQKYGYIYKKKIWDDVTVRENLKSKATAFLSSVYSEDISVKIKAVDMNLTDEAIEEIRVGHVLKCKSPPSHLDAELPVSELRVYLADMSKNTFTLGTETRKQTYTTSGLESESEFKKEISNLPAGNVKIDPDAVIQIQSVAELPEEPDINTLYLIRGTVMYN